MGGESSSKVDIKLLYQRASLLEIWETMIKLRNSCGVYVNYHI